MRTDYFWQDTLDAAARGEGDLVVGTRGRGMHLALGIVFLYLNVFLFGCLMFLDE